MNKWFLTGILKFERTFSSANEQNKHVSTVTVTTAEIETFREHKLA